MFQSFTVSGLLQTQNKKIQRKFSKASEPDGKMAFSEKKKKKDEMQLEPAQGIFLKFYCCFNNICGIQVVHKCVLRERFHAS